MRVSDSARISATALLGTVTTTAQVLTQSISSVGHAADVMHTRTHLWSIKAKREAAVQALESDEEIQAAASMRYMQRKQEIENFIGNDESKRTEFNEAYARYSKILADL